MQLLLKLLKTGTHSTCRYLMKTVYKHRHQYKHKEKPYSIDPQHNCSAWNWLGWQTCGQLGNSCHIPWTIKGNCVPIKTEGNFVAAYNLSTTESHYILMFAGKTSPCHCVIHSRPQPMVLWPCTLYSFSICTEHAANVMCRPQYTCRGHRKTCGCWFTPSTTWSLKTDRLAGLAACTLIQVPHQPQSCPITNYLFGQIKMKCIFSLVNTCK